MMYVYYPYRVRENGQRFSVFESSLEPETRFFYVGAGCHLTKKAIFSFNVNTDFLGKTFNVFRKIFIFLSRLHRKFNFRFWSNRLEIDIFPSSGRSTLFKSCRPNQIDVPTQPVRNVSPNIEVSVLLPSCSVKQFESRRRERWEKYVVRLRVHYCNTKSTIYEFVVSYCFLMVKIELFAMH